MQLNHAPADLQKFADRQEEPVDGFAKCYDPPYTECVDQPYTPTNT